MKEGFSSHRLESEDFYYEKERTFVDVMKQWTERRMFKLDYFKNSGAQYEPMNILTDVEEKIVSTVIQWLGTPVGQSYLSEVEKEYEKRVYFKENKDGSIRI